jgi:acid stress-induced BolA-like protein IbaG/YrbA
VFQCTLTYRPLAKKVREILEEAIAAKQADAKTIVDTTSVRKRVHAGVISEAFNRMSEREKQDLVWDALQKKLDKEEILGISAVITFAPEELR